LSSSRWLNLSNKSRALKYAIKVAAQEKNAFRLQTLRFFCKLNEPSRKRHFLSEQNSAKIFDSSDRRFWKVFQPFLQYTSLTFREVNYLHWCLR
jgi:hypothetical protein